MSCILGLDIGGANLKAAHTGGVAKSLAFPLWKQPGQLGEALAALAANFPAYEKVAVTMTGELCDCFATKREGVAAILTAVEAAFPGKALRVWRTDGRFTDVKSARATALQTGAANWHALATFACRYVDNEPTLLIDMGSTTTDIIPLLDGRPAPRGWTDTERLRTRELLYVGMARTPVCALLGAEGMAEFFATMRDVTLLTGYYPEDSANCDTADGRPATKACAHARLARMIGADAESLPYADTVELAQRILEKIKRQLSDAVLAVGGQMARQPYRYLFAGEGAALAAKLLGQQASSLFLRDDVGEAIARAACAYAVAILAKEARDA